MFNPESPPEIVASSWLNTEGSAPLADNKGKVVLVSVFQMLCPASVKHGLPQASRIASGFNGDQVAVMGLHSVFEQHDEQSPEKLKAFLDKEGIDVTVAIDAAGGPSGLPKTFAAYELQGTPTVLLFDRQGRLRRHYLGAVDDVRLAAEVMALTMEPADAPREVSLAIERRLHIALADPDAHAHDHEGGCCGGHAHDHHHHDNDDGSHACCGGHDHDHAHDHGKAHVHAGGEAKREGCDGNGGCGCKH